MNEEVELILDVAEEQMNESLSKLDISYNQLNGEIPDSLGDILDFNLSYLNLSNNTHVTNVRFPFIRSICFNFNFPSVYSI